jgi:hypothetical protein
VPFDPKSVARALILAANIHEGRWKIYVRWAPPIGMTAQIEHRFMLAGVMAIAELGLSRVEGPQEDPLEVDAAQVNPGHLIEMPNMGRITLPGRN